MPPIWKVAKLKVELAALDLQKYEEVEYTQMVEKAESDIMLAEEELKQGAQRTGRYAGAFR